MNEVHRFVSTPPPTSGRLVEDTLPGYITADVVVSPPARLSWRDRLVGWVERNRTDLIVVAALLVVFGIVHGIGMNANPAPVDDEGTYVAQGWAVVARHALTPYTYWYDHPPLGWVLIGAWGWITHGFRPGAHAIATGREFMLVTGAVTAALLYLVARRLGLSRPWSAGAVMVWALCPLELLYGRQVYLDNVALMFMVAALALALSPRRGLWPFCAAGGLMGVAVLCKETFLVFAAALVWQIWQQADRRTRSFCLTGFFVTFLVVLIGYPLYALLKGEFFPGPGHVSLFDAVRFQLSGRQSSGSVFSSSSAAGSLVRIWLGRDHWLLGAGLVLLPVALVARRLRPVGIGLLIGLVMGVRGGYLPEPYVIALLPLAALVAAGSTAAVAGALPDRAGDASGASRLARRAAVLGGLALVLAAFAPSWARADGTMMTSDAWGPYTQAESWVETHAAPTSRILVDDTMWVDLVEHGFNRRLQVVWFYKLGFANNLDPSVTRSLPDGWRDFSYVIVTPSMRGALVNDPRQETAVQSVVDHSTVVASFGTGPAEIQVRRVSIGGSR